MKKRQSILVYCSGVLVLLFCCACSAKNAAEKRQTDLPSLEALNIRDAVLERVVSGLDKPWAFAFISPEEMLVTEFDGALKRVNLSSGESQTIDGVPPVATGGGQVGMLDVVLDPDFAQNRRVYFTYATRTGPDEKALTLALSRAVLEGKKLKDVKRLLLVEPVSNKRLHFGGALAFDKKKHLYVTAGDRYTRKNAASLKTLTGKVLRMDRDGKLIKNNPFVDDPDVDDRIFSYGHRNPQGIVYDSQTGELYIAEHGPRGGDEVNRLIPGAHYGWPTISYGTGYDYNPIAKSTHVEGLVQPLYYYLPSLAISPIAVYRGDMFPQWDGSLLVGALRAEVVSMLDLEDGKVISEQRLLSELSGRVRDIDVAHDGSVFFLLEEPGAIFRLSRKK